MKNKKKERIKMSRKKSGLVGGIITGVIIFIGIICLIMCIEKIPVGYEAVVYSINGGVQDETLTQGWHIISPTKKAKIFTIINFTTVSRVNIHH